MGESLLRPAKTYIRVLTCLNGCCEEQHPYESEDNVPGHACFVSDDTAGAGATVGGTGTGASGGATGTGATGAVGDELCSSLVYIADLANPSMLL